MKVSKKLLLLFGIMCLSNISIVLAMDSNTKKEFKAIVKKIRDHKELTTKEQMFIKANPNRQSTDDGWSYLLYGVQANHKKFVIDLLMNTDADVKTKNRLNQGVLHLAASNARPDFITLFTKRQWGIAFDVTKKDNMGKSPLKWAQTFAQQKQEYINKNRYNGDKGEQVLKAHMEQQQYLKCIKKLRKLLPSSKD